MWIDKALEENAIKASPVIAAIDRAYEQIIRTIKDKNDNFKFLPLNKNEKFEIILLEDSLLVNIWEGRVIFKKILYDKNMYGMEPFSFDSAIYARFSKGKFVELTMNPPVGFHFLWSKGLEYLDYPSLCLGDMQEPTETADFSALRKKAEEIVKMWEIINLNSCGKILLPDTCVLKKYIHEPFRPGDFLYDCLIDGIVKPMLQEVGYV